MLGIDRRTAMDPATATHAYTAQDWVLILGAFFTGLTGLATVLLQLRGNAKTEAAKQISADNNAKVNAVVAQVHNIADAVPGASTAPTDAIVKSDPATIARQTGA
jgi:hypothetical protein